MSEHRGSQWDDEPHGDLDEGKRRRWRRPWNVYLSAVLGTIGAFMTIGAATAQHWPGTVGGLCVLAVPFALIRADGPKAKAGRPPPPAPTLQVELTWYGVAAVLVVAGVLLTTIQAA
jgi:hypothetical protein